MKIVHITLLLLFTLFSSIAWADSPLSKIGGEEEEEFLEPDVAFVVTIPNANEQSIKTNWLIQDGYYLYKDKISISPADESQITLGDIPLPAGEQKEDEYFGTIYSLENEFNAEIPITKLAANTKAVDLVIKYQGCAKAGLCYPPITKNVTVNLAAADSLATSSNFEESDDGAASPSSTGTEFQSEQDKIASTLATGSLWTSVFRFGFIACLYSLCIPYDTDPFQHYCWSRR